MNGYTTEVKTYQSHEHEHGTRTIRFLLTKERNGTGCQPDTYIRLFKVSIALICMFVTSDIVSV